MLDPLLLSRLQFAFVIAFHFLLPAFTIGLASYIAVLEGLHVATGKPVYLRISMFWIKVFAIAFGMGVVSGIVMPFQFGTNWSGYSEATGSIVAPLMAYEGLTAFSLEAAFLGVLLFGRKLVPPWAHFGAAVIVALGTLFSAFWILAANSWMHTPAGFEIVDGRFVPTDWLAVIFSPSFPYRFAHTVTAVYLTTAFTVIGVAAWYLRSNRLRRGVADDDHDGCAARVDPRAGAGAARRRPRPQYVGVPAAEARGDRRHLGDPRRAARGAICVPDEKTETNRCEIAIPKLASLYLTHRLDGT